MSSSKQNRSSPPASSLGSIVTRPAFICLLLAAATVLVLWPLTACHFVNYDDPVYVTENRHILEGFTWENLRWAFTNWEAGFWHPLTWLSYLLDRQCFGMRPGGFHLTSLLLHAANTVLLFVLLHRMTRALWRSAFVAALFSLHPLHVESVAWIAERKDVLSALFWMLAMLSYVRYVQKPEIRSRRPDVGGRMSDLRPLTSDLRPLSSGYYWLALLFFTCGLMSKSMVVTLPVVLLLLDYWPLGRVSGARNEVSRAGRQGSGDRHAPNSQFSTVRRLIFEKLPFFAASLVGGILTLYAEKSYGALQSATHFPIAGRIANAALSSVTYLFQTLWPENLTVYYPYPKSFAIGPVAGAAALVLIVSAFVCATARRRPYLTVGWLWFCITLLPVIGIIQIGVHSRADRYTYLPLIGVFIAVAWGAGEALTRWRIPRSVIGAAAAAILVACAVQTRNQSRHWLDSESLFRHAVAVIKDNALGYSYLGAALAEKGRMDDAISCCQTAIQLDPDRADFHNNLGVALFNNGNFDEAIQQCRLAVRLEPNSARLHHNLGRALAARGEVNEAMDSFHKALQIDPESATVYNSLGYLLAATGRIGEAMDCYRRALRINPNYADAHNNLAGALTQDGKLDEAVQHYREAVRLKPDSASLYNNLGYALAAGDHVAEALECYQRALQLNPDSAEAHNNLGNLLAQQGHLEDGVGQFNESLRINPRQAVVHFNLGCALARLGRTNEAVAHLNEALRLRPDFPEARQQLGALGRRVPE